MSNPKYPFGPATVSSVTAAATVEVAITNSKTIVDFGELAAAMTVDLVIDPELEAGAELHIKALSDGTARDITFGDGFNAPVLAGVISKTKVQSFVYNGTAFEPMGAALQID